MVQQATDRQFQGNWVRELQLNTDIILINSYPILGGEEFNIRDFATICGDYVHFFNHCNYDWETI